MDNLPLDPTSIGYNEAQEPVARELPDNMERLEQDLVDHVFTLYDRYGRSEVRKQMLENRKTNWLNYRQTVEGTAKNWPWDGASSLNLPLTLIMNDNLEPRIVASLEGKGDELCRFEDVGELNPEIKDIQDWFNDELIYRMSLRKIIRDIVHNICNDGTVFVMPSYESREEVRRDFVFEDEPVIDPATGIPVSAANGGPIQFEGEPMLTRKRIATDPQTGEMLTNEYIDTLFEGGSVSVLNIEDVYCADDIENWEDADIVRYVEVPYSFLREQQERGVVGYQNIKDDLFSESVEGDAATPSVTTDNPTPNDTPPVKGQRIVPCLEAHIVWDVQSSSDRDQGKYVGTEKIVALVTLTTKKLIRLCLQRDLNFQNRKLVRRLRINPEHSVTYGIAPATKVQQIQKGASDTFNLIINSGYITMMPWYFYGPNSGLDKPIELFPGCGVPVADPSAIKFPAFTVNPAQYISFLNIFMSMWERIGSVGDIQVGRGAQITGNRAQTATATMMQVQEANVKHSYTGKMLQEEFADLLDVLYDLYYMNCPMEIIWEQSGQRKIIDKASMRKRRRFVLVGTTENSNKYIDRMEAEALYNMLLPNPIASQPKLLEDLLDSYGKDNTEGYVDPNINQVLMAYKQDPQGITMAIQNYMAQMMALAEQQKNNAAGKTNGGGPPNPAGQVQANQQNLPPNSQLSLVAGAGSAPGMQG